VRRPRHVKVGPHKFRLWWNNEAATGADVAGAMMEQALVILIDPKLQRSQQRATLLHECLHAVWSQTWMDKKYPDEDPGGPGERIIHCLTEPLLNLLRENPELLEFLTKED
jgi:hypothetical protein